MGCLRLLIADHVRKQVLWHTVVEEAYGREKGLLGGLKVRNVQSGEVRDLPVNGLFFAIGHEPASQFLAGQVSSSSPECAWLIVAGTVLWPSV